MNDSCEKKINRALGPNNQVFPLESPKVFLHDALASATKCDLEVALRNP
jgi:hypothetical protein